MRSLLFNVGIITIPKVVKIGAVFVVDILLARYLGVTDYGLFSLVHAVFVSLSMFSRFGLDNILVREKVNGNLDRARIGMILAVRMLGGSFAMALFLIFAHLNTTLTSHMPILVLLSLGFWAVALSIFEPLMQADERFRSLAVAQTIVILVGALVKILLLFNGADVAMFWVAILGEVVTGALITQYYMARTGILPTPRIELSGVWRAVIEGAPFLLASLSVIAFMRMDQIMLAYFHGNSSVGYYSAALRISESFFVIATLVSIVIFPRIIRLREADPSRYRDTFTLILRVFFILGTAIVITIQLTSNQIIFFLLGEQYSKSAELLRIHAWVVIPAFWGTITHRWLVAERLARFELIRTSSGLGMNLALNFALIPAYGAVGAGVATVISQTVAYIAINFAFAELRPLAGFQLRAIGLKKSTL